MDNYYGKDISNVWSLGYSGSGVTFAVTGAGLDTKLLDLQRNVVTYLLIKNVYILYNLLLVRKIL